MATNEDIYEQRRKQAQPQEIRDAYAIMNYVRSVKSYEKVPSNIAAAGYGWDDVLAYYDLKIKKYYGLPIPVQINTSLFGQTSIFENGLLIETRFEPGHLPPAERPGTTKPQELEIIYKKDEPLKVEQSLKGTYKESPKITGLPSERVLTQQRQLLFAKLGIENNIKKLEEYKETGIESVFINGKETSIDDALNQAQAQKFQLDALSRQTMAYSNKGVEVRDGALVGKDERMVIIPAETDKIRDITITDVVKENIAEIKDFWETPQLRSFNEMAIKDNEINAFQIPLLLTSVGTTLGKDLATSFPNIAIPVAIGLGTIAIGSGISTTMTEFQRLKEFTEQPINIPMALSIQAMSNAAITNFPNINQSETKIDDRLFKDFPIASFPNINQSQGVVNFPSAIISDVVTNYPSVNVNENVYRYPSVYENTLERVNANLNKNVNANAYGYGINYGFGYNYAYEYGYGFNYKFMMPSILTINPFGFNFNFGFPSTNKGLIDLPNMEMSMPKMAGFDKITTYVPDLTALTYNLKSSDMNISIPAFSGMEFRDIKI